MKYNVSFIGRLNGAIGTTYKINTQIEEDKNATTEEIKLKAYDNYEHISQFKIH